MSYENNNQFVGAQTNATTPERESQLPGMVPNPHHQPSINTNENGGLNHQPSSLTAHNLQNAGHNSHQSFHNRPSALSNNNNAVNTPGSMRMYPPANLNLHHQNQQFQQHYITKLEPLPKGHTAANPGDASRSHLTREYRFYKYMNDCCENLIGIPNVHDFGAEGMYRYLVMDECGPSLDSLFRAKSRAFTPLTILRIAQQIISRVEFIHNLGLVHRDIKPENFCMGMHEKCHVVFMIDFGLAKMFRSKKNGGHVPIVEGKRLAGTARYASIWTHEGYSQSRRDDLEGVWFTLLYFARGGSFPWDTGPSTNNVEEYIGSVKKKIPPDVLCKSVPEPLKTFLLSYIGYVRKLKYEETPDYYHLRQQCIAALHQLHRSETLESLSDYCWFRPAPTEENGRGKGGEGGVSGINGVNGANASGGPYNYNIDSSLASAQSQALGLGAQSSRMSEGMYSRQLSQQSFVMSPANGGGGNGAGRVSPSNNLNGNNYGSGIVNGGGGGPRTSNSTPRQQSLGYGFQSSPNRPGPSPHQQQQRASSVSPRVSGGNNNNYYLNNNNNQQQPQRGPGEDWME